MKRKADAITKSYRDGVRFLMKSEPDVFSIDDLITSKDSTNIWDGVRNYQARNIIREMNVGDLAFFYHSNAKQETGIYGIVEITRSNYPDPTAVDPSHKYYDPKCKVDNKWSSVDVRIKEKFSKPILLSELKKESRLTAMELFRNGRLSVQHIRPEEAEVIAGFVLK